MKLLRINPRLFLSQRNIIGVCDVSKANIQSLPRLLDLSNGKPRTIIFLDSGDAISVNLRIDTVLRYMEKNETKNSNSKN